MGFTFNARRRSSSVALLLPVEAVPDTQSYTTVPSTFGSSLTGRRSSKRQNKRRSVQPNAPCTTQNAQASFGVTTSSTDSYSSSSSDERLLPLTPPLSSSSSFTKSQQWRTSAADRQDVGSTFLLRMPSRVGSDFAIGAAGLGLGSMSSSVRDSEQDEDCCPVCLCELSLKLAGEKPHVVPVCGHQLRE